MTGLFQFCFSRLTTHHPRLIAFLLLAPALAYTAAAQGAVTAHERAEPYAIRGSSAAELRVEMNAKGPLGGDGRRHDRYTRWQISWRYGYRSGAGRCEIDRVHTEVTVTMTLPSWINEAAVPAGLRAQWRRYLDALETHEKGHARNGLDAAQEIDRAIAALAPLASCDALGTAANAAGNNIIRKYNQRDLDYDRTTDHGRTQGARFP